MTMSRYKITVSHKTRIYLHHWWLYAELIGSLASIIATIPLLQGSLFYLRILIR